MTPDQPDNDNANCNANTLFVKRLTSQRSVALILFGFVWLTLVNFAFSVAATTTSYALLSSREYYGFVTTIIIILLRVAAIYLDGIAIVTLISFARILARNIEQLFVQRRLLLHEKCDETRFHNDVKTTVRLTMRSFVAIAMAWFVNMTASVMMTIIVTGARF